jgi:hypothetical protein
MRPESGSIKPMINRSKVDLPQPLADEPVVLALDRDSLGAARQHSVCYITS